MSESFWDTMDLIKNAKNTNFGLKKTTLGKIYIEKGLHGDPFPLGNFIWLIDKTNKNWHI